MTTYRVYDIKWETDGEDVDLPSEMSLEVEDGLDSEEVEEIISDWLSDETGFLHDGYRYEETDLSPGVKR